MHCMFINMHNIMQSVINDLYVGVVTVDQGAWMLQRLFLAKNQLIRVLV
jgi:hypothetical protein